MTISIRTITYILFYYILLFTSKKYFKTHTHKIYNWFLPVELLGQNLAFLCTQTTLHPGGQKRSFLGRVQPSTVKKAVLLT